MATGGGDGYLTPSVADHDKGQWTEKKGGRGHEGWITSIYEIDWYLVAH